MATLQIADKDLQNMRRLLETEAIRLATLPSPKESGAWTHLTLSIKLIRKINHALKRVHGHDCCGNMSLQAIELAMTKSKGSLP